MDTSKYFEKFKIFKLKGNPYILVMNNYIYGIEENFESICVLEITNDTPLVDEYIACRYLEKDEINPIFFNIRIFNILFPLVMKYTNNPILNNKENQLCGDMGEKVYSMKSTDGSVLMNYHLDNDINTEYILSLNYSLFPVAKNDTVDNYVVCDYATNELIMKSIVHKKQKIDIAVYHKFLII